MSLTKEEISNRYEDRYHTVPDFDTENEDVPVLEPGIIFKAMVIGSITLIALGVTSLIILFVTTM